MRIQRAFAPGGMGRCDGFTLIEVLIAVSLLSLLAMLLMGGVRFGTRVMESGLQRADQTARLSTTFGFLRDRLEQAQPLEREPDEKGNTPTIFMGEPSSLTFVGVTPPYLAVGGYELLTIHAERRNGHRELVATWRPFRESATTSPAAAARSTVLFDDAETVAFRYFGSTAPDEAPRWHQGWHDQARLPSLVKLTVGLRDGRTRPALVVALRLGGDVF